MLEYLEIMEDCKRDMNHVKVWMDGYDYVIGGLTCSDLEGIVKMIGGACLPERREFNGLKGAVGEILKIK
mgnify:CR=1 FL=1